MLLITNIFMVMILFLIPILLIYIYKKGFFSAKKRKYVHYISHKSLSIDNIKIDLHIV
jgi:hypothetical protein